MSSISAKWELYFEVTISSAGVLFTGGYVSDSSKTMDIYVSSSSVLLRFTGLSNITLASSFPLNKSHTLKITQDSTGLKAWVDGVQTYSGSSTGKGFTSNSQIGMDYNNSNGVKGTLKNFYLKDLNITPSQKLLDIM